MTNFKNSKPGPVHGERISERNRETNQIDFRIWFQPRDDMPGRWLTQTQWDQVYTYGRGIDADKPQDGTTVTGYRTRNSDVTDQMNRLKEISRTFLQELDAMKAGGECDPVWLDMAKRDMQTACMFACRAVAKPSDDC